MRINWIWIIHCNSLLMRVSTVSRDIFWLSQSILVYFLFSLKKSLNFNIHLTEIDHEWHVVLWFPCCSCSISSDDAAPAISFLLWLTTTVALNYIFLISKMSYLYTTWNLSYSSYIEAKHLPAIVWRYLPKGLNSDYYYN